jgi:hypothetical protein
MKTITQNMMWSKTMYQSEQINELVTALAKAQGEISPALKDSNNPFFKSKYADLSSVWNACREPLSRHGIAIVQTMDSREGQLFLTTTLAHSSGQWMKSYMPIIMEKNTPQALGSAITYMRRYALSAIVGMTSEEDDDGNEATRPSSRAAAYVDPTKIDLPLPNGIEQHEVEEYLNILAGNSKKSLGEVKSKAAERSESFWKMFYEWKAKKVA